ncbi:MAG: hypothetical protein WCD75_18750, partial [Rhodoplanes sp.]
PYSALVGEVYEHPVKRTPRRLHYFGVIEVTALQVYRNLKTDGTSFDLKHGANLLALLAFFNDFNACERDLEFAHMPPPRRIDGNATC